ncbi:troponin I-like isoform X26 [Scylla paramamosain]|uniref:troponin I-like isoform X26 n=1 Tax=Scylla paramamosain TaxID=85552 RepID=UPI0030829133
MSSDEEEYSSEEESSEEEEEDPAAKAKAAEEAKRKQDEINKRKAEVRKRLEEQSQKKAKKGFMTPERKKKLRLLLRKKAAEELKKEQERKAAERRKIIDQRCGQPKNLDGANEAELEKLCRDFHSRIERLEGDKWDLEHQIKMKDYQINELNIQVNDLRGKFIKPTLKKVSKYENKFAKLQKKAAEFNFRNQLKTVKKKEFELEDDKEKTTKPGWAAGGPGAAKKEGEEGAHPAEGEATAEEA